MKKLTPEPEEPRDANRRKFLGGAAFAGLAVGAAGLFSSAPAAAQSPTHRARAASGATLSPIKGKTHSLNTVLAAQPELPVHDEWDYHPFSLTEMDMGEGVYNRGYSHAMALARAYPVDRNLAVFRRNAGLDVNGAEPPGGWEEYGPAPDEQRWGPAEYSPEKNTRGAGGLLRGHYGGHSYRNSPWLTRRAEKKHSKKKSMPLSKDSKSAEPR